MPSSACSQALDLLSPDMTQTRLQELNRARLTAYPTDSQEVLSPRDEMKLREVEMEFLEVERAAVSARAAAAPRTADAFEVWFRQLSESGPGQGDPLFPWLASHASLEDMRWFLHQELAGEAGFDDLVALTQVRLPTRAKMELARNYWDEMGRGRVSGMHGPMLHALAEALQLHAFTSPIVWESQAVANLLSALAANRHYTYQSLGALGAVELTAPGRCEFINAGLRRLGVPAKTRQYYALHATLDVQHADAWLSEVLKPLVASDARLAPFLAEGALMRLQAGARCFARYRRSLLQPAMLGGSHAAH